MTSEDIKNWAWIIGAVGSVMVWCARTYAMLRDIRKEQRQAASDHKRMRKSLSRLRAWQHKFGQSLKDVTSRMDQHEQRLAGHDNRFDQHHGRLVELEKHRPA